VSPHDKLPNTHLVLDRPDRADLETEVAQGGTQVVLNGNGLRLKQLAMGQQHPKLITLSIGGYFLQLEL
jgi:hypothetical protein